MDDQNFTQLKENLSANIKALRKAQKLSQEDFAHEAGIDRTYVSQLERKLRNPSLSVLSKLADSLGTDIASLLAVPSDQQ